MSNSTIFTDTGALVPADYGDPVARISDLKGLNGDSRPALQSSTALRPVYGRGPLAGRRNLVLNSEDFTVLGFGFGAWSVNFRAQTTLGVEDALGGTSAVRIEHVGDDSTADFNTRVQSTAGELAYTSAYVRRISGTGLIQLSRGDGFGFRSINPTSEWQRFLIFDDRQSSGGGQDRMGVRIHTPGDVVDFCFPQYEYGGHTPYQRVGVTAFDITEPVTGAASPAYLRFDLSDDKMTHTFPNGFTGDVMLFGRNGSWVEENVTIAPNGGLDIGPRAVTGGIPGSLDAIGDVVGWLPVGRVLSEQERQYMVDYYKERGAKGLLVPGPELVTEW
jgi:hypothetical protein